MFKYLLHNSIINSKIYKNKRSHCALNPIEFDNECSRAPAPAPALALQICDLGSTCPTFSVFCRIVPNTGYSLRFYILKSCKYYLRIDDGFPPLRKKEFMWNLCMAQKPAFDICCINSFTIFYT